MTNAELKKALMNHRTGADIKTAERDAELAINALKNVVIGYGYDEEKTAKLLDCVAETAIEKKIRR